MTLKVYYYPTPNGRKVTIALEEMQIPYQLEIVDILRGGQDVDDFRAINPNGRIPALRDDATVGGSVTIFESGAILQYLGRKSGLYYPSEEAARTQIDSWIFWQMAGLGPMAGQLNWFTRAAAKPARDPAETSLALHRYRKECARLFTVLDRQLADREYVCDAYSLADMAIWPWIDQYGDHGGDREQYPALFRWHAVVASRPAVGRAMVAGADLVTPPDGTSIFAKSTSQNR